MTDAVRDQIKMDAKEYGGGIHSAVNSFIAGAERQHPIAEKVGYNQAIDDAIEIVRSVDFAFIVQELEALKTEIKK